MRTSYAIDLEHAIQASIQTEREARSRRAAVNDNEPLNRATENAQLKLALEASRASADLHALRLGLLQSLESTPPPAADAEEATDLAYALQASREEALIARPPTQEERDLTRAIGLSLMDSAASARPTWSLPRPASVSSLYSSAPPSTLYRSASTASGVSAMSAASSTSSTTFPPPPPSRASTPPPSRLPMQQPFNVRSTALATPTTPAPTGPLYTAADRAASRRFS